MRSEKKKKQIDLHIIIMFFLKYILGSEFGKDFKKELQTRGIRQYFTHTGVWAKISLVEIAIRTIKRLFFRCLIEFNTLTYGNIIKLVQNVYNNRLVEYNKTNTRCPGSNAANRDESLKACNERTDGITGRSSYKKMLDRIFKLYKHTNSLVHLDPTFVYCFFSLHNCRPHSALMKFSPFEAHFNSHFASLVARNNAGKAIEREREARDLFSLKPENWLKIGEKVLLKTKRHNFHKTSPLFYPHFRDTIFTVSSIDKKNFPWLYGLSEISDAKRKFYAFELLRLDKDLHTGHDGHSSNSQPTENNENKILVKKIFFRDQSTLRSGKKIPGKQNTFYLISKQGKDDQVPAGTLSLFKKALGNNVLVYDSWFHEPKNQQYII